MQNLTDRIKKYRETLRPATIKTYATNMRRLAKLLDSDQFEKKHNDIKILKLSPSVKKTLVTAGITYEKMNGNKCPKLAEMLKVLDKEAKEIVSQQKMTRSDRAKWITLDDITRVRKKVEAEIKLNDHWKKAPQNIKSLHQIQLLILMTWYSQFATRNEIGTVIVKSAYDYNTGDKEAGNFVVVPGKKPIFFSFSVFKTSRAYKKKFGLPVIMEPNKRFQKLIKRYLKIKPDHDDAFFFDSKNQPLRGSRGANLITLWLKSCFMRYISKPVSTNHIRKAWINNLLSSDKPMASLVEQQKMMAKVGQTDLFTLHTYKRT